MSAAADYMQPSAPTSATRSQEPTLSLANAVDTPTLMRIKSLELRARAVVEGFLSGLHQSPYHGFSVEFSEYRPYTPGDDPRHLDWRLFARTDRHYIRRFEDETNLRSYLLVDLSRSMGYGSDSYTKADYAKTAAATLALFLSMQRDAVGLLTFDDAVVDYLPARYRPGHLRRVMLSLQRTVAGDATNLERPLDQVARTFAKRGLVVMISDLLAPIDLLEKHLAFLRARGHEVVLFQLLDPTELNFEFSDPAMFEDLETGRHFYVDPATARAEYEKRFNEHTQRIRASCANLGVDFSQVTTDRPLELILFDFLSARMRRGRQITRRRDPGHRAGGGAWAS